MTCPKCQHVIDRQDIPHVVRTCEGCGRIMYVHEPGKHGRGFKVQKGDQLVIPAGWLKLSLNPLKGTGRLFRSGVDWFAQKIFIGDFPKDKTEIRHELQKIEDDCSSFLKKSEMLQGLDIENSEHSEKIIELLREKTDAAEWWRFLVGAFLSSVRAALENNDIEQAIWAIAGAERFRSMAVFKEHLEEVVWMGHSASRIVNALKTWENSKTNADEEFWQITFTENCYMISQIFAVPLVFIKDRAYVGGMNIDRQKGKVVDYLFSMESSREAILVEIKTPVTQLLGSKYRGVFRPSKELTGAIVQVLDYRNELTKNLKSVVEGTTHNISLFSPRCIVIIGNGEHELKDEIKRKSFELFRSNLKDVEIVTYDELFRKVEILANLFNLVKPKAKE